jgi:hypothetical protein
MTLFYIFCVPLSIIAFLAWKYLNVLNRADIEKIVLKAFVLSIPAFFVYSIFAGIFVTNYTYFNLYFVLAMKNFVLPGILVMGCSFVVFGLEPRYSSRTFVPDFLVYYGVFTLIFSVGELVFDYQFYSGLTGLLLFPIYKLLLAQVICFLLTESSHFMQAFRYIFLLLIVPFAVVLALPLWLFGINFPLWGLLAYLVLLAGGSWYFMREYVHG